MMHKIRLVFAWMLIFILVFPLPASAPAQTAPEPLRPDLAFTRIVAGRHHTCALDAAGGVWCWGMNDDGQLGNGANTNRSVPVAVLGLPGGATRLAAGAAHTCALTAAGGVKCWGSNFAGQLGDGTLESRSTPVEVSGLASGVSALAADGNHTCALLAGGGLKCWGHNHYGQIGDGTHENRLTPVSVSGLASGVSAVAAGEGHTCAILDGGGLLCWGWNSNGQLGDGSNQDRVTPTDVTGLGGSAAAVSAGGVHTCAILDGGGVRCWGLNWDGRLGNGTTTDSYTPVEVVGLPGGEAMLEAGESHTCVWSADGRVRCWGSNEEGTLGSGDTVDNSSTPREVSGVLGTLLSLSAGWEHTCVLTAGGQARCWGRSAFGQLGDAAIIQRSVPVEVRLLASGAQKLSASLYNTCVLTAAGGVNCWGRNYWGELGDGNGGINSGLPVQVVGLASGTRAVSASGPSCALTSAGGVKCWGLNNFGQLGDGTKENSDIPVQVTGLTSGVEAISGSCALLASGGVKCWGGFFGITPVDVAGLTGGVSAISGSCALLDSGGVKCWGDGGSITPVYVPGLESGVRAVSVGGYHACALMAGGGIKCWGDNEYGQLGCGSVGCGYGGGLVDVVGLPGEALIVAAGFRHTCAILTGGRLVCWGRDADGELGDGLTTNSYVPVDVQGLASGVTEIALGDHTCAIAAGRAKCWGPDVYGELGQGSDSYSPVPVDVVTGAGEHLRLSENYGQPGSLFTVTGWNLPPSSAITLTLNSAVLSPSLETNSTGSFTVFLDTTGADPGYYVLRLQSAPGGAASFVLEAGFPLRPQEGGGPALSAPPGLGVPAHWLYLPAALKK